MSSSVVVARHTVSYFLHFIWTGGPPGRRYWRNNSLDSCAVKGKTIPRMCWISVSITDGLLSTISHRLSKPILVPRRVRHHAVHHRLWTSLRCVEHWIFKQCVVEGEIVFVETCCVSIVDVCACTSSSMIPRSITQV